VASKNKTPGELLIARNPKALKEYEIKERLEAGLMLTGSEVKSLRARRADLEGAYVNIRRGEARLFQMHIAPYEHAGPFGHEPRRSRKLLMNKREIERWEGRLTQGLTIVPLSLYFKKGWAKVELGLAKGRKKGDKRHELRKQQDIKEARAMVDQSREGER
jgi:SsrA-binding protein